MDRVSIQMCCFNGERHLAEAIESILLQTHSNWELIFWDNCSTDGSAAIVKSFDDPRIVYHLAPNHTDLGGGRARSWPLLTGDFIAFLDVDDTWEPDKLALQIAAFVDPEISIVSGDVMWVNENHRQLLYADRYPPEGHVTGALLRHYFLSLPAVMIRREMVKKIGNGFDPSFSHNADFDLFLRISTTGKLRIIKQHIASWRVDMNSQSWANRRKFEQEHFKWAQKYRSTKWVNAHQCSFIKYQVILIAKKLYFALINAHYEKTPTTGLLGVLDYIGWLTYVVARKTPAVIFVRRHSHSRIAKWMQD